MAYDRADWHYGGDFPKDLPSENGGTHIGFFLAWAIARDLAGEIHFEDDFGIKALEAVRKRTMSGREFLFKQCDEKFWSEDLNDEGNEFACWYYSENEEERPDYLTDYAAIFEGQAPHGNVYYVEDTWENFDKIAAAIDQRFAEWKQGIKPVPLRDESREV